jgi:phosphoribosyl 1,2-cyclic phosphodiesterase
LLVMSVFITSLNSGSNGNCYYVGNKSEAVLIDCGISCREVEKRMKRLNLSIQLVKAVFVSHEHGDHIKGVEFLSKKYTLPVHISPKTLLKSNLKIGEELVISMSNYESATIGSLTITPFPKFHDASDPSSFIIRCNNTRIGIFTDIGLPCEHVIRHFKQCNAAFLETNYDEKMLESGNYPYHLKKRITSGMGHLSNTQALQLFKQHRPAFMSHLVLSHLSKNNNTPELVRALFNSHASGVEIIIASRYNETPVYQIQDIKNSTRSKTTAPTTKQLAFSFS